ncbi:MAG TPA: DUF1566 domain-containing protein [Leptospiraceae bacterium]|nr:DUF1566 domain-containing protein [Leptospiraceae bacterium]
MRLITAAVFFSIIHCTNIGDVSSDKKQILNLSFLRTGTIVISGKAVKGTLSSASVRVHPLGNDGKCAKTIVLSEGRTDQSGNYELKYFQSGRPVCVIVSPDTNGSSKMYDEKSGKQISWTDSENSLVTVMNEPTVFANGKKIKNRLNISPISSLSLRRIEELVKSNTDPALLGSVTKRANKEIAFRLGLKGSFSGKELKNNDSAAKSATDRDIEDINDLNIDIEDSSDPAALRMRLLLAGFSQLAYENRKDKTKETTDLDISNVIKAFTEDAADGMFDGQNSSGQTVQIGTSGTSLSGNSLTENLLPAIQNFVSQGGNLAISPGEAVPAVSSSSVSSSVSFTDTSTLLTAEPVINAVPLEMPVFSISQGTYNTPQYISLASPTDAQIYYTLDGTTPNSSSSVYSAPFHIWTVAGVSMKAKAIKKGFVDSGLLSGTFSYNPIKTRQTSCFTAGFASTGCTGTYLGQDAYYSKGSTGVLTDNGDSTVSDTTTGLLWQKCSYGASGPTCATGTQTSLNFANASSYCSSLTAGGKTWRIPTIRELHSIHYLANNPRIDTSKFGATQAGDYWASDTAVFNSSAAWTVSFYDGTTLTTPQTNLRYLRCVTGTEKKTVSNFTDLGDGTVKDHSTGLYWQKCTNGQNSLDCSGTGTAAADWASAVSYCNTLNLAGKTWRLPNKNELVSILDYQKTTFPLTNTDVFPNMPNNQLYWSSTTNNVTGFFNEALVLDFGSFSKGRMNIESKGWSFDYVKCVAD